jgi:hypothetical protein
MIRVGQQIEDFEFEYCQNRDIKKEESEIFRLSREVAGVAILSSGFHICLPHGIRRSSRFLRGVYFRKNAGRVRFNLECPSFLSEIAYKESVILVQTVLALSHAHGSKIIPLFSRHVILPEQLLS